MKAVVKKVDVDLDKGIKQSNRLVEANYYLSLTEQKAILFFISQLDKNAEHFCKMEFSVREVSDALGLGKNCYTKLSKLADDLLKKVLTIRTNRYEKGWYKTHWVQSMEYLDGEGKLIVQFDEELTPELLQLKEAYVKSNTRLCLSFKGKYTARFYMMICQYERKKERIFFIKDLIEKFQLGETYKKRISNIKARIIEPAIEELKVKSDIKFDYEYIKDGRVIYALRIFNISRTKITPSNAKKTALSEPVTLVGTGDGKDDLPKGKSKITREMTKEEQKIFSKITNPDKWNIASNTAKKLIRDFGIARVEKNLLYCDRHRAGKQNLAGFLIEMIRLDAAGDEERRIVDKRHEEVKQKERDRKGLLKEIENQNQNEAKEKTITMTEENRKLGKEKLSQMKQMLAGKSKPVSVSTDKPTLEEQLEKNGQQRLFEKSKDEEENESIFDNESEKAAFKSEFENVMKSNLSNEEKLEKILSMEGDDETGNLLKMLSLLIETSGTVNKHGHREIKLQ